MRDLIDILSEDAESDFEARERARAAHRKIADWIAGLEEDGSIDEELKQSTAQGGSLYFRAAQAGVRVPEAPGLIIVLAPQKRNHAYGTLPDGTKVIVFSVLREPYSTKYLTTRFRTGAEQGFIHEFQHLVMSARRKQKSDSAALADRGDYSGYFNDPDETNAFFQEAAHKMEDMVRVLAQAVKNFPDTKDQVRKTLGEWLDQTVVEVVKDLKRHANDAFLQHATPKTLRHFEKRAARFANETYFPMIEKALQEIDDA